MFFKNKISVGTEYFSLILIIFFKHPRLTTQINVDASNGCAYKAPHTLIQTQKMPKSSANLRQKRDFNV